MNIELRPSSLKGEINIPASKSCAHRALICAALSDGVSVLTGITMSKDIEATIGSMSALGASFKVENDKITVNGISAPSEYAEMDCNESGSTLRFIIPIAAALGTDSVFLGRGRLPQRPIDIYKRELSAHGIEFVQAEMPYRINGKLTSGKYYIEGDVSSQFITGLLFALPMLDGDSEIVLTSKLQSRPYVDITVDTLRKFGIEISETETSYSVKGNQKYTPCDMNVEGDYSQAAFFLVANAVGSSVDVKNLNPSSVQGDKRIIDIISECMVNEKITSFKADCSDIPDLVPILTVLGAYGSGESVIYNAERLRIKESDRLETSAAMINNLGGNAEITSDGIVIRPNGGLKGGIVDGCGDHRIVMATAIAALGCKENVVIKGAEAAEKSYPDFFDDYTEAGGIANVINME